MEIIKAATLGAVLTATVALVIGSQGTGAGQLAVHTLSAGNVSFYWSWPLFLSGTGLAWGIMLLQR
ncbi:MAG: hypothetical protein AAGK02_02940 [Pseudomonadota bacterium]